MWRSLTGPHGTSSGRCSCCCSPSSLEEAGKAKLPTTRKVPFYYLLLLTIFTLCWNTYRKATPDKGARLTFCCCLLKKKSQFCLHVRVRSVSRWQEGKVELQVFPPMQTANESPASRYPLSHWNWTAWPVFRLSSCTLPFCISLGLWQPLAAGGREQIVHRWRNLEVLVNVGVDRAALHTFTCWCWEAPGAVGLTEESPGAQQLQPVIAHVRGVLWERFPLCLHVCIVYRWRRPTGLCCRDSQKVMIRLHFVDF